MTRHAITEADFFDTAYRKHREGMAVGLHDRVAFERCLAPPCVQFWTVMRAAPSAVPADGTR